MVSHTRVVILIRVGKVHLLIMFMGVMFKNQVGELGARVHGIYSARSSMESDGLSCRGGHSDKGHIGDVGVAGFTRC